MLPIRDSNKMATCNSATFSLSAENTGKNLKKFLYKNTILYHYQYHICYNFTENTRFIRYPLMGRFGASSPIWFMFALPTVTIIGPLSISKIRLPASSNNKNKTRAVLVFVTERKNNVDPRPRAQKKVNYFQLFLPSNWCTSDVSNIYE